MTWIWILLAALVAVAALRYRRRLRQHAAGAPVVDDDALRRIIDEGRLTTADDEPLDLEEIAREEDSFWEETWDDAEEE
jgi:hypothetical protein